MLFKIVLCLAMLAAFCCPAIAATTPGVDVLEIVFDEQPIERGLSFDRTGMEFQRIAIKGQQYDTWAARQWHDPARQWERTVRIKITDKRFLDGDRPAVDIEIEYHKTGYGSTQVFADTQRGPVDVGGRFGPTDEIRTISLRVDDARFSSAANKAEGLGSFDLRISSANGELYLRRIRVIGYDPDANVQWNRMLKAEKFAGKTDAGLLVFTRGEAAITAQIENLSRVRRPLSYRFAVRQLDGQEVHRATGGLVVDGSSSLPLDLRFDAGAWKLGPYVGRIQLLADDMLVVDSEMQLGIISETQLPKARDNEFFYGLDVANNHIYPSDTPIAAAWYRLMGVDFLRAAPTFGALSTDKMAPAMAFLEREQLRASLMFDLPRPASDGTLSDHQLQEVQQYEAMIRSAIKQYAGRKPGRLFMTELGNEPDLPGFWPGPISSYIEVMNRLSLAAEQARTEAGIPADQFLIGNGGLSFAGKVGDERSREFLRLVDPARLDIYAYHGHGPGYRSERSAYDRLQGAIADANKPQKPTIDTETGFYASSESGFMEQARTVVEKFAMAHSAGSPGMVFFRLFMEGGRDSGYGLTLQSGADFIQPKPVVLSYRAMVERLRHHRFVRIVELPSAEIEGVHLFLYEHVDANAAPTGAKALLAFNERFATTDVLLRLDPNAASDIRLHDLFGNELPVHVLSANLVSLPVERNAVYLSWRSDGDSPAVAAIPPMLQFEMTDPVLCGTGSVGQLLVSNPTQSSVDLELIARAESRLAISVEPARHQLKLAAGQSVKIPLTFTAGESGAPLDLPRWWRVFVDADPEALNAQTLASMPASLPRANGGTVAGKPVWADAGRIDLAAVGGVAPSDRRPAVAYTVLYSPSAVRLPVAANADWYMAWYVNGEEVYNTLEEGNKHRSLGDHQFELPLKQGANVIAVRCDSGSHGWTFDFAGPQRRAMAVPGQLPVDRLSLELRKGDGDSLASAVVPLTLAGPVSQLDGAVPETHAQWMALEPAAVLGEQQVENLFIKEPNQSRWYHGSADLSAMMWLRDDQANGMLRIAIAVRDDLHRPATAGQDGKDGVKLTLTADGGESLAQADLADGANLNLADGLAAKVSRLDGEAITLYELSVPRSVVGAAKFRLALTVSDDDGFGLKQTMSLPGGMVGRLSR